MGKCKLQGCNAHTTSCAVDKQRPTWSDMQALEKSPISSVIWGRDGSCVGEADIVRKRESKAFFRNRQFCVCSRQSSQRVDALTRANACDCRSNGFNDACSVVPGCVRKGSCRVLAGSNIYEYMKTVESCVNAQINDALL